MSIVYEREGVTDPTSQSLTSSILNRRALVLPRMRNEFTQKQHQTELINFTEYSTRRQKELRKRHAFNQKQLPKNIKVNEESLLVPYIMRPLWI